MQDTEIIHEVLQGNQHAFKKLVEKYTDALFRTATGFVHNRQDAEEIVQESFLRAYQSLAAFNGKSAFSTWLYRITVNHSINYIRANKRKRFWSSLSQTFVSRSSDATPDARMEQQEQRILIREAMETLPQKQRIAFVLSKYEELSQKQIAEVLNITEGAVEQLIQRAKINLRKKIKKT